MLAAEAGAKIRGNLDRLLVQVSSPEFAIAYSGGGDSTAVLGALRGHPHCKAVFIVDHGLRNESGNEARGAQEFAKSLGFDAEILRWQSEGTITGIQEKARKARYRLMGMACRARNISNLATAHNHDDQAETLLMRYDRHTDWRGAAGMSALTFAPLWPELAGITMMRPALSMSRKDLRDYNRAEGLPWIEDPSNADVNFTRIQGREYLKTRPGLAANLIETATQLSEGLAQEKARLRSIYAKHISIDQNGIIYVTAEIPQRLMALCLQAASGDGTPIKKQQLSTLSGQLASPGFAGATLGGAQIKPHHGGLTIVRDPGAVMGRPSQRPMGAQILNAEERLWDGRFWISSGLSDVAVQPLGHVRQFLTPEHKAHLQTIPSSARDTLPAVTRGEDILSVGTTYTYAAIKIRSAVTDHLEGRLRRNLC